MNSIDINHIAPSGPHIEGFIRFSYEEGAEQGHQRQQFELLSREHAEAPLPGQVPRMKTHPLAEQLMGSDGPKNERLITEVPITFFNKTPEGCLVARYEAVDLLNRRVVCCGDGKMAKRRTVDEPHQISVTCHGPEHCQFANSGAATCKLHTRLRVHVEGSDDPLGVFEFQSTGINSYRAIAAKLKMFFGLYGDLRGLPLRLTSWAKSSVSSAYATFYAANIEVREGMTLKDVKDAAARYREEHDGLDLDGLDKAIAQMVDAGGEMLTEADETVVMTWTPASTLNNRPRLHQAAASTAFKEIVAQTITRASQGMPVDAMRPTPESVDANVPSEPGEKIQTLNERSMPHAPATSDKIITF